MSQAKYLLKVTAELLARVRARTEPQEPELNKTLFSPKGHTSVFPELSSLQGRYKAALCMP